LQPSDGHLPVLRYAPLESFTMFEQAAKNMGFSYAACGPMVRSSYYADEQAHQAGVI
jgi:lipoic acid synthetase